MYIHHYSILYITMKCSIYHLLACIPMTFTYVCFKWIPCRKALADGITHSKYICIKLSSYYANSFWGNECHESVVDALLSFGPYLLQEPCLKKVFYLVFTALKIHWEIHFHIILWPFLEKVCTLKVVVLFVELNLCRQQYMMPKNVLVCVQTISWIGFEVDDWMDRQTDRWLSGEKKSLKQLRTKKKNK